MEEITQAARIIKDAQRLVAFSGAGMSAESGVPTFRDPGGLWDRFDPSRVGTREGLLSMLSADAGAVRRLIEELVGTFEKACPNPGHYALAELERMGILRSVITQNVDNFHCEAGNTKVIEVHGNLYRYRCLGCLNRKKLGRGEILGKIQNLLSSKSELSIAHLMALLPQCGCGGMMRPDVVMFGESVQDLPQAIDEAQGCDVMLILGTSGVVYPAASLPRTARGVGAKLVEINPTENSFAPLTEVYIKEKTGEALPRIVKLIKGD